MVFELSELYQKASLFQQTCFFCYLLSMQKMPTFQLVILKGARPIGVSHSVFYGVYNYLGDYQAIC